MSVSGHGCLHTHAHASDNKAGVMKAAGERGDISYRDPLAPGSRQRALL